MYFKMIKAGIYSEDPAKPQQCTQVAAFKTDFTDIFVISKKAFPCNFCNYFV